MLCLGVLGLSACKGEEQTQEQGQQYFLTVINDSSYGLISPALNNETNSVKVNKGDNYTFTIRPREGYEVNKLLIDGEEIEGMEVYTFSNINANHSIAATYTCIIETPTVDDPVINSAKKLTISAVCLDVGVPSKYLTNDQLKAKIEIFQRHDYAQDFIYSDNGIDLRNNDVFAYTSASARDVELSNNICYYNITSGAINNILIKNGAFSLLIDHTLTKGTSSHGATELVDINTSSLTYVEDIRGDYYLYEIEVDTSNSTYGYIHRIILAFTIAE